jgi:hypothetical protein
VISGNLSKSAAPTATPKRSIQELLASQPKKQRRDEPIPAVADEEDWATVPDFVQIVEDDLVPGVSELNQLVTDNRGLVRVGPQPVAAHERDVRSAPSAYVNVLLKKKLEVNSQNSDSKIPVILNATQQSEVAWAFNALCNAATLHYSFHTIISKKAMLVVTV